MKITLKTLHLATQQQVFDKVALHLLKQDKKSERPGMTGDPNCKYRHGNLMCAAGCLMADDEYDAEFEGANWHGIVYGKKVAPEIHFELIKALQVVHDRYYPHAWPARLHHVAMKFDLSDAVVRLSGDFKRMCGIGHGCGLRTLGEAYTQCELHYDAMWTIDEAPAKLNELAKEIEDFGADALIVDVMGADWAALEDEEMEKYMNQQLPDDEDFEQIKGI